MNGTKKTWSGTLQEILVGLILMFVGLFAAAMLHNSLTPNIHFVYVYWFALMMIPLLFYARSRGVLEFNRWDFVCGILLATCLAVAASISRLLGSLTSFYAIALVGFCATHKLRSCAPNDGHDEPICK